MYVAARISSRRKHRACALNRLWAPWVHPLQACAVQSHRSHRVLSPRAGPTWSGAQGRTSWGFSFLICELETGQGHPWGAAASPVTTVVSDTGPMTVMVQGCCEGLRSSLVRGCSVNGSSCYRAPNMYWITWNLGIQRGYDFWSNSNEKISDIFRWFVLRTSKQRWALALKWANSSWSGIGQMGPGTLAPAQSGISLPEFKPALQIHESVVYKFL